jgi:hypothetical protein
MSMWGSISNIGNVFGSGGSAPYGGLCNAQNAYPSSSAAMAAQLSAQSMAAQLQNAYFTSTMSSTTAPGSFVDYEDRQNPTAGSALLGSSSGKFVLLVDDVPAEYPNPSLEDSFGLFGNWRISYSRDTGALSICSGRSFLILPLMIVDALNAKVTRDDIRSIKIAKEL